MKNINLLITFYLCLLSLTAWTQELEDGYLYGVVIDAKSNPVFDVQIKFDGVETSSTSPEGLFRIPVALFDDQDVELIVMKEGFYLASMQSTNTFKVLAKDRKQVVKVKMTEAPLPQGKKRIAVLPFCDSSPTSKKSLIEKDGAFTSRAADALNQINTDSLEVIDQMQVWAVMQEQDIKEGDYCVLDKIVKLAQPLNANLVLLGFYEEKLDGSWNVHGVFFDLVNKRSYKKSFTLHAADLITLQKDMYFEILKRLNIPLSLEARQIVESRTTGATTNQTAYAHNLNAGQYLNQKEPKRALVESSKAIQADTTFFRAHEVRANALDLLGDSIEASQSYGEAQKQAKRKGIPSKIVNWIKRKVTRLTSTKPNIGEMILVKGGTFEMGSSTGITINASPKHSVTLDDFYIGKYEVTIGEYMKFVEATNLHYPEWLEKGNSYNINENGNNKDYYKKIVDDDKKPIVGISWNDAVAYCDWLGEKYHLPTEAQWEYAAGGGETNRTKYAGINSKNDLKKYAWYSVTSGSKTHQVGTKKANQLGIHDMSGNVWEWCQDIWHENYENAPTNGSAWMVDGNSSRHVVRGGSWLIISHYCRVITRFSTYSTTCGSNFGFRVASSSQ